MNTNINAKNAKGKRGVEVWKASFRIEMKFNHPVEPMVLLEIIESAFYEAFGMKDEISPQRKSKKKGDRIVVPPREEKFKIWTRKIKQ